MSIFHKSNTLLTKEDIKRLIEEDIQFYNIAPKPKSTTIKSKEYKHLKRLMWKNYKRG